MMNILLPPAAFSFPPVPRISIDPQRWIRCRRDHWCRGTAGISTLEEVWERQISNAGVYQVLLAGDWIDWIDRQHLPQILVFWPSKTMIFNGFPLFPMVFHDFPWYPMIFHDFPWLSMVFPDFPWFFHCFPWFFHDFPWFSMIFHGFPMVFHCFPWFSMVFHGFPHERRGGFR